MVFNWSLDHLPDAGECFVAQRTVGRHRGVVAQVGVESNVGKQQITIQFKALTASAGSTVETRGQPGVNLHRPTVALQSE